MPDEHDGTTPWSAFLKETEQRLTDQTDGDPRLEARWMLEEVTGATGANFFDAMKQLGTVRGVDKLDSMVARRLDGEPIQYVLGSWSFRQLDLLVDRRVLIPRPETEAVVGVALAHLDQVRGDSGAGTVIDLGTGSGAIGLSIAAERPGTRVLLTDASADALQVARANLAGLGIRGSSVEIAHGSWFEAVPERYLGECDVVVSNPPYIGSGESLDDSVQEWEPESALRAGPDGLDDIRLLLDGVAAFLRPTGAFVVEMAIDQVPVVAALARSVGFDATSFDDLSGRPRGLIVGQPMEVKHG